MTLLHRSTQSTTRHDCPAEDLEGSVPMSHWQWDSRRSRLGAWVGWDASLVFGVKIVATRSESATTYGGRYVSLWLGPVYVGAGWVW